MLVERAGDLQRADLTSIVPPSLLKLRVDMNRGAGAGALAKRTPVDEGLDGDALIHLEVVHRAGQIRQRSAAGTGR